MPALAPTGMQLLLFHSAWVFVFFCINFIHLSSLSTSPHPFQRFPRSSSLFFYYLSSSSFSPSPHTILSLLSFFFAPFSSACVFALSFGALAFILSLVFSRLSVSPPLSSLLLVWESYWTQFLHFHNHHTPPMIAHLHLHP